MSGIASDAGLCEFARHQKAGPIAPDQNSLTGAASAPVSVNGEGRTLQKRPEHDERHRSSPVTD